MPNRPPRISGVSRSADDIPSTHDAEHLRPLATTSRQSFVADLPLFSRETSPISFTTYDVRKTRKSIKEGLRSPIGNQKLPERSRRRFKKEVIMSDEELQDNISGIEEAGLEHENPRWKLFLIEKDNFKLNLQKEVEEIKETLQDEDSEDQDIEDAAVELEGLEKELQDLETTWRALVSIEEIETAVWTNVGNELRNSRKDLNKIKKRVQKALGLNDLPRKKDTGVSDNALALLRNSSQAPKVTLPTFSGEIAEYAAFKKNFQYVITQVNCQPKLWGTHLYNALKGDAREYVGSQRDWIDKYNELWDMLDDKYANRWVLANETISTFICKPVPGDSIEEINKFFYSQIDSLKSVLDLKMSLEQVGVSIICQSLPEEIGKDIKQGLRALYPNKKQYAFTIKDVVSVYNDSMAIRNVSNLSETLHSTLSMKAAVKQLPKASSDQTSAPNQQNNPPQSNPRSGGRGASNGNNRGRGRGQNRGRGGSRFSNGRRRCLLCSGNDHPPWTCPSYTDAPARRNRLKELNLCMACTGRVHKGNFPDHIECTKHPGYKHMGWTCGNEAHPGKQEPQD